MFTTHSDASCWDYLDYSCPAFNTGSCYFWLAFVVILVLFCTDATYFLRSRCVRLLARRCRQPRAPALLSTHYYTGIYMSPRTNLGDSMHSAAAFLKDCDLALRHFLCTSHMEDALHDLDASLTNSSNNTKFRRPLGFLQSYCIQTKLTWWDQHSLYLEQKLLCPAERGTICAINYSRQNLEGATMAELLHCLPVCTCLPREPPPEIESWIVNIKTVNRQLTLS